MPQRRIELLKKRLCDLEATQRERAIESFRYFAKRTWPIIEPNTPLVWTWYLAALCDALERQMRGDEEYRKLLVCIPPGTAKSTFVNVFAPSWQWLHEPSRRKLCVSNDDRLAERDSRKMREIIRSPFYRELVEYKANRDGLAAWAMSKDQAEKVNFENTAHGFRQSYSVGAKFTGKRGDDVIIDDPIDAKDVINGSSEQVARRLAEVNNVIEKVLPSRVNRMSQARWTIIMQRLHDDDPAGRAIKEEGWRVLEIQMEFEPDNENNHHNDPREEEGELLNEELFPRPEVDKLKIKLGNEYHAQYQQRPRPRGGGMLKEWYWCFWYPRGMDPPPVERVRMPDGSMHEIRQEPLPDVTNHTQSWDCAFKDTRDSAYVVGQVWASQGANAYLLDQVREKMDVVATIDAIRALTASWPQAMAKLIEDKANGPAVIRMLRDEIPGLDPFNPPGGKEERANAIAPLLRAGNVWIPHPAIAPWIREFLDETKAFPMSTYKDQVDAMTQYLLHWQGDGFFFLF